MENKRSGDYIADNIRSLADERGIKHFKLAEMIGISKKRLSDILNGRRTLRAIEVPPLADALDCTYSELLEPRDN